MRKQSQEEEIFNGISHGIGFLLAFIGSVTMIAYVAKADSFLYSLGAAIYCFTMLMVYGSSTVYHSVSTPKVKHVLRLLDHISIYLYIAGSYTAFLSLLVREEVFFWNSIMWTMAFLGILSKIVFGISKYKFVSVTFYTLMGCMAVFFIPLLRAHLSETSFVLLVVGCFLFLLGGLVYGGGKFKYNHGVWHIFVIFGSTCHYAALMYGISEI